MSLSVRPLVTRMGVVMALLTCASLAGSGRAPAADAQNRPPRDFSRAALAARAPAIQTVTYHVNGKVRPLLFWIGRDDIGEAFITWRRGADGRRGFEMLVGSDPARAPRAVNRWGFIAEEIDDREVSIIGLMKESSEQTLEEAEAKIAGEDAVSVFKAARTTIAGDRATTWTTTIKAPSRLTYRDVDAMLELVTSGKTNVRSGVVPAGVQPGFLAAMDVLIRASIDACVAPDGGRARGVSSVPYLYNHTVYDVTLVSCEPRTEVRTGVGTVASAVDGRFVLRNRTTRNESRFRVVYGTSGEHRETPLRAVFRPRWWMEVEMEIGEVWRSSDATPCPTQPGLKGGSR